MRHGKIAPDGYPGGAHTPPDLRKPANRFSSSKVVSYYWEKSGGRQAVPGTESQRCGRGRASWQKRGKLWTARLRHGRSYCMLPLGIILRLRLAVGSSRTTLRSPGQEVCLGALMGRALPCYALAHAQHRPARRVGSFVRVWRPLSRLATLANEQLPNAHASHPSIPRGQAVRENIAGSPWGSREGLRESLRDYPLAECGPHPAEPGRLPACACANLSGVRLGSCLR